MLIRLSHTSPRTTPASQRTVWPLHEPGTSFLQECPCAQRRFISAQADQSLRYSPEDDVDPWLPTECPCEDSYRTAQIHESPKRSRDEQTMTTQTPHVKPPTHKQTEVLQQRNGLGTISWKITRGITPVELIVDCQKRYHMFSDENAIEPVL